MARQIGKVTLIEFNGNDFYHQKLKNISKAIVSDKIAKVLKMEEPSVGFQLENSLLEEYEIREILRKEFHITLKNFNTVDLSEYLTYYCKFEYNGKLFQYVFTPDSVPFMWEEWEKRLVIIEAINE